jgi:8-amino-7-oxononanoate synthase
VSVAEVATEALGAIQKAGTYRRMRVVEGAQGPRMRVDGRDVLMFAGSNYLDLASHPEVREAAARAARDLGCAAGGSRLINGNLRLHEALEEELAGLVGAESALVFATGYMANVGAIPALVGPGDCVLSDALGHASIVDGCRLSRAEVRVFAHGDVAALEVALRKVRRAASRARVLVAVDGIYSMDGDLAPLRDVIEVVRRYGAMLLVDDAHGTGALGRTGAGTLEELGVENGPDLLLGTLGKSLGSFGAFVAGSRQLRDLLVNVARSFIFSCALSPPQAAAARAALRVIAREPWRRERLRANACRLRAGLARHGISTAPSTTHIVPVVVGENCAAMTLCERLLDRGFYAQGIRHPSVPRGTARLRITPMATHSESEIDALVAAISEELRVTRASWPVAATS